MPTADIVVSPGNVNGPDDISLRSGRRLAEGRSTRHVWPIAVGLLVAGIVSLFLPWQQSVRGTGVLTALAPGERSGTVPAVIGGAIAEWHVGEGDLVRAGQRLVTIREIKDEYLDTNTTERYREQLAAKQAANEAKRGKQAALRDQIDALERAQTLGRAKTTNSIGAYEAAVDAAVADSAVAADQLARRERLAADGLSSTNDLQSSRLRAQQSFAKAVEKRNDLANARIAIGSLDAEYSEKLAKARADLSATTSELQDGISEVSKLRNAVTNLERRSDLFELRAPQDGFVVRAMRAGVGEQVKAGDAVVTIQPFGASVAAALRISATDIPLLSVGLKVRLQFDGWPALQFSGWPGASVGTFGGIISVIDQVSAADGSFRVLVRQDPTDDPWPPTLRQGSGVIGWALLKEVRLGYELWRRVNGFPQSLTSMPGAAAPAGEATGEAKGGSK